jgi:NADH-quinone oxidoreductase subunit G
MNVADICPVGALTTRDFRFKIRVWFLKDVDGICTGCSRGCNVDIGVAKNEVQRYVPRRNDAVNQTWMCDVGRLSYKEIARPDRLTRCQVRGPEGRLVPATVRDAVDAAARFLDALGTELAALAVVRGDSDEILVEAEKGANGAGARALGFGDPRVVLERIRRGGLEGLILLGHDLLAAEYLGGADALSQLDTLIVLDTHQSPLERVAHVVFPVRHAAEKDATYTNSAGRVQRVRRALVPGADALDEGDVVTRLGVALGLRGFEAGSAWDVRETSRRLSREVPAFAGIDLDSAGRGGRPLAGSQG